MPSALAVRARLASAVALALALGGSAKGARAAIKDPFEVFRFSAGSTLFAPPGLGRDGSVYVGSGEGYVHALSSDGRYRWSYTVQGRVVAAPVEEPTTGRVFVVTSDARLYAFEPDAHLRWVFSLPPPPERSSRSRRRARCCSSGATTTCTA
jgi:outer membrane protein assembly factor BamB